MMRDDIRAQDGKVDRLDGRLQSHWTESFDGIRLAHHPSFSPEVHGPNTPAKELAFVI